MTSGSFQINSQKKKKMENPTFCTKICPIDYKDQTQDKLDNRDKKETIK